MCPKSRSGSYDGRQGSGKIAHDFLFPDFLKIFFSLLILSSTGNISIVPTYLKFFVQDPDEKCLDILKENKICLGKVQIFSIIFRSIICFLCANFYY